MTTPGRGRRTCPRLAKTEMVHEANPAASSEPPKIAQTTQETPQDAQERPKPLKRTAKNGQDRSKRPRNAGRPT
ncbi:MAG: hypothetical protein LBJ62_02830 [Bifidobacteriaceae bacterium]|nr:hypothetical protein [Bifidobacteriaceae bacterium]